MVNLLFFLKNYFLFIFIFIAIIYLLSKYQHKISDRTASNKLVVMLFSLGGLLSVILILPGFFVGIWWSNIMGFLFPFVFLLIPATIAILLYIRVTDTQLSTKWIALLMIWGIVSLSLGILLGFLLTMDNPILKPGSMIGEMKMVFSVLTILVAYILNSFVISFSYLLNAKYRSDVSLLVFPAIPLAIGVLYLFIAFITSFLGY
ncbi:MAG: hypothetical protein R6U44_05065 [Archaeoglobaceae archaeon]